MDSTGIRPKDVRRMVDVLRKRFCLQRVPIYFKVDEDGDTVYGHFETTFKDGKLMKNNRALHFGTNKGGWIPLGLVFHELAHQLETEEHGLEVDDDMEPINGHSLRFEMYLDLLHVSWNGG